MTPDDAVVRLTAGLDEDERIARAATQDESTYWAADHGHVFVTMDAIWYEDEMIVTAADISDRLAYQRAEHIARHDPVRTLKEVAAKRKALDWYLNDDEMVMWPIIEAIAAIYSDHPDYQQEWSA